MEKLGLVVIALGILAFSLVSGRLKDSVITPPMIFAAFGLVIGNAGLGLADLDLSHGVIHTLAEVTLVLVLFSDAARIDTRTLLKDHNLPVRMLLVGMPLIIVFGTLAAVLLPLGLGLVEAALLAAILAPTDAALGQSVVSNPRVPVRIRQALNVESGLNDGIAVPFVILFASLVAGHHGSESGSGAADFLTFGALQVILGPIVGILFGCAGGWLMDRAAGREWMVEAFEGPAVLALAGGAYFGSELVGGNGFIAAFVAGLAFGYVIQGRCKFILEFAESEGQLLTLITFLVFGAAMIPQVLGDIGWAPLLYGVLSLTIIRMAPIALSLAGTGVNGVTVAFLGWFGPRGLASVLFGLLIVEELKSDSAEMILTITVITVTLSILAHGLSAAPAAAAYARSTEARGECAEKQPATEMPTRTGYAEP